MTMQARCEKQNYIVYSEILIFKKQKLISLAVNNNLISVYNTMKYLHVFRNDESAVLFVDSHRSKYLEFEQNHSVQYVSLTLLSQHP